MPSQLISPNPTRINAEQAKRMESHRHILEERKLRCFSFCIPPRDKSQCSKNGRKNETP